MIYASPVEFYINAPSSNIAWQPQTAGSQANELYHLPEELFIVIIIHKKQFLVFISWSLQLFLWFEVINWIIIEWIIL